MAGFQEFVKGSNVHNSNGCITILNQFLGKIAQSKQSVSETKEVKDINLFSFNKL